MNDFLTGGIGWPDDKLASHKVCKTSEVCPAAAVDHKKRSKNRLFASRTFFSQDPFSSSQIVQKRVENELREEMNAALSVEAALHAVNAGSFHLHHRQQLLFLVSSLISKAGWQLQFMLRLTTNDVFAEEDNDATWL